MFKIIFLSFVLQFTEPTQLTIHSNTCDECSISVSGRKFELCIEDNEWILEHDGEFYPTSYSINDSLCLETSPVWYKPLRSIKQ